MVSLLLRLYDVGEGRITVDGHDLRDVTLDSLALQSGVVPQEPFLFTGTVKQNIRYNRTDATDEEIVEAAKAVGAHEFITEMEHGYDTELQERGGNLSVGQRQLLSFAPRARRRPTNSHPGRGNGQHRHAIRDSDSTCRRKAAQGADRPGDRSPPVNDSQRRPHRSYGPWPHSRAGQPRRAHGRGWPVRAASVVHDG